MGSGRIYHRDVFYCDMEFYFCLERFQGISTVEMERRAEETKETKEETK